MRKLSPAPLDSGAPCRRPGRWLIHSLFALALGLLLAPLAYEVASVCIANWQGMYGRIGHIETPMLDALHAAVIDSARLLRRHANGYFLDLPWRPSAIITLGFAWALFMAAPLRRA